MKYYSETLQYTNTTYLSEKPTVDYNEVVAKLKNNYKLHQVIDLSTKLYPLTKQLKNKLFYTYINEIFENLYISRFVLPQQQFCEIQHFIFNNPQGKGGNPLVGHIDTFFNNIFINCPQKHITENYRNVTYKYYNAAKQSENSHFSNEQINLLFLPEYEIFHSYSTGMQPFHEFVHFAKHTIAFNIFKDFLLHPEKINPDYFFNIVTYVSLKDNNIPTLNEVSLFSKLMEQEHFNKISGFSQSHKIYEFLENVFFFSQPRVNARPLFYYANQPPYSEKVIHLFNYDILDTLNQKDINLNVLFNEKTPYHNFSAFVLASVDKKLKNTDLTYDQEGYNHLLTLLKVQDYFYMNNKFPKKNFMEKHTKI